MYFSLAAVTSSLLGIFMMIQNKMLKQPIGTMRSKEGNIWPTEMSMHITAEQNKIKRDSHCCNLSIYETEILSLHNLNIQNM
jgi:hypothetical protein